LARLVSDVGHREQEITQLIEGTECVPLSFFPVKHPPYPLPTEPKASRSGWLIINMNKKVAWGVMGAANIALKKVLPAMQRGEWCEIAAIASRDHKKAENAARQLGISKAYGSYEELLADPEIEAIYNPLPNHLHVPWSIKAAEAGKHVLCEKPICLSVTDALSLLGARERTGMKIQEAFMIRTHPQWRKVVELVRLGRIGTVHAVTGFFSYFNRDPKNIRNIVEYGGGALMDIGCYLAHISRLVFGEEPTRVVGVMEKDPEMLTDILASGILHFPSGQCTFTCGTQIARYQRVQIIGTRGRIEVPIPLNPLPDQPSRIIIDEGGHLAGRDAQILEFALCDQFTIQGDLFSRSIREGTDQAVPLEDSVRNIRVLAALFRSAESGQWQDVG
jgi:predicted dehydrogenase